MDLKMRRKEAFLLLLTVIILALLVDLLGSLLFSVFFEGHTALFAALVVTGLLGVSILGYFLILSRSEKKIVTVQFPFCFSQEQNGFIDIPHSPPSVHARVHFNRLSEGVRKDLMSYDALDKFFGSDFDHFLNNAIQATLLTLLLEPSWLHESEDRKKLGFHDLPETMKRNSCLRYEASELPDFELSIPNWTNLDTYGSYARFIRVTSKYGNLEIEWNLGVGSGAWYTGPYVAVLGVDPASEILEFMISVSMSYECRYSWMHSRGLDKHLKWVLEVKRNLELLDWKNTRDLLPLVILESIVRDLRDLDSDNE